MADFRKTLEARRNRRRGKSADSARAAGGEPIAQARGGFGIAPGGRPQSSGRPGLGVGDAVKAAGKFAKPVYDMFQDPKAGPTRPGMAEQRTGERADYTGAMPGFANSEGSLGNVPMGELQPGPSFNTDFLGGVEGDIPGAAGSMDLSGGGLNVGSYGVESGAGAAPGASASGGMSAGMSGLAGAGIGALYGMAPGMIGKALGVDPETGMIINAASTAAAPAATAATAGALGVGAAGAAAGGGMAGAAAGLAASGPALIAAAPIAAGMIMQAVLSSRDTAEAVHEMKQRLRGMSQLPGEMKRIDDAANLALTLTKNMPPEEALKQLKGFNTLQNNFQNNGWESILKSGETQVGGGTAGQGVEVELPEIQSALAKQAPQWQAIDRGRIMSQDIATKSGMGPDEIRAGADRFLNPIDYLSPAARERLFPTRDAQGNQYTDDSTTEGVFSKGTRPQSEGSYNSTFAPGPKGNTPNYYPNMFAPLAEGQAPGIAPSGFSNTPWGLANEEEYNNLYKNFVDSGYQLRDTLRNYEGQNGGQIPELLNDPAGGAAGAIPGSEIGGAGKRSPQFLTPELDNRAEAAAGKLGGGRPGQQDQGTPFGMGGSKRGGGMGVGAPMGGRPGGNAPFGGMGRQTMMPQQGGGVQAQRKQPNGVV